MMNVERLSVHEDYEELSNEPAFSKMVKEWKAYRSTSLSPADIPALTVRAEAAEAERDRAIKQMCQFCKSLDKKAGIKPVCAADCEWRGQQAGKGEKE